MPSVDLTPAALEAAGRALPTGQPIVMINLLRYNEKADYPTAEQPFATGRDAYLGGYVPTFAAVASAMGVESKPLYVGRVAMTMVAPADEHWEDVAVVEYPSFEAFRRVVVSDEYDHRCAPHRRAALADWRFLGTTALEFPS